MSSNIGKLVSEFTLGAASSEPVLEIANKPTIMDEHKVRFIIKMIIDECKELAATVAPADMTPHEYMLAVLDETTDPRTTVHVDDEDVAPAAKIAEQVDALADIIYYIGDCASKHKLPLDAVLDEVHKANMMKGQPNGFKKRADGKIIKPEGWEEPNIEKIVERYL